ncbi:MAG TPA: response regulator [Pseudolabrys sp.]|jgi:CheY-like chemotaxis protein|nr:response regulator [Pseudolabrys sp.]
MILVVEDNPDVKTVATTLLEQLNYRTIAVESAKAALDFLAAGKPVDLVFSDVMLPGDLDGLGLARTIGKQYPHIPQCVQCSASDRRDSREAYRGLPPMAGGVVALASPGYVLQPRSARPRQEWTADPLTGGQT